MHFAVSTTWGPTDTTRASLPFNFAESALAAGDTVVIMLFSDAVMIAVDENYETIIPPGSRECFWKVLSHPRAEVIVSKHCAETRGIYAGELAGNCRLGGMNDFHAHVALDGCKAVSF